MSKVVLLDPGHGGYDPGAVYNGHQEKDLNLMLAKKVASRLEDIKVLFTRDRDVFVSLADRVAMSRRVMPDLFLSLHANAGGGRGFESFISSNLGSNDPAVQMQSAVHNQIMEVLHNWTIVDRGKKRAAFYVLRHNPYPAVLIESLFLDNEREANLWRESMFVETLADGVAMGICQALDMPKVILPGDGGEEPQRAEVSRTLYTVQVGAFAYIENARQRLAEAQGAGFSDAWIYKKEVQ